jgi:MHS family proline/betaine transporter-like MFS transporter
MTTVERRTRPTRRRATLAASVGNFVEWFDFGVYGFLAPVIATQFFPASDGAAALLATFAIFGVAFLVRPIGGLVFGRLGDRIGRRATLSAVVLTMAIATTSIGLLPTFAAIGILAPILLTLARMVQGFSAGGETGGAVAYIVEHAPSARRGLFSSWVFFTQGLGGLCAALVVTLLTSSLGPDGMAEWGWRVPFLLALPLGLVGLYLRVAVAESPRFHALARADRLRPHPLRDTFVNHRPALLRSVGIILTATTLTQIITAYMPAYLTEEIGLAPDEALRASVVGLAVFLVLCPMFGLLSDRRGRRPVMALTPIAALVLALPAFLLLSSGEPSSALLGGALLGAAVAPFGGAGAAALAELFPTAVRYSGVSIAAAVASSIIGGFTPLGLTWLVAATGAPLAPGWVVMGLGALSLWATMMIRETSHSELSD